MICAELRSRLARSVAVAVTLLLASPAAAFTLDWASIGWDSNDTSGSQSFPDIDGSGIDLSVSYSDTMFFNDSVSELYTSANAPIESIEGALKFTNSRLPGFLPTNVTLTFSKEVLIESAYMVSHSITDRQWQEHTLVEARNATGDLVDAVLYYTTTPGYTRLDPDGNASYETIGLGQQADDEYGDAHFSFEDPIKSFSASLWITDIDGTDYVLGKASVGIGTQDFFPAHAPEPGTPALLGLGFVALAGFRAHRSVP